MIPIPNSINKKYYIIGILGIRDEKTRMKVTPPLAVAPITQDGDVNVISLRF